jgi:hypothetical protein
VAFRDGREVALRRRGGAMSAEEWALAVGVVCAGLWSGLLGMLTLLVQPMLRAMDGRSFYAFMAAFLPIGRHAWFNYACALGMAVAPIVALVVLWDDRSSVSFVLTAIALGLVVICVFVVSNVWKEPLYDVILAWDPDAPAATWEDERRRYFTINWVQMLSTWAVFVLLLVAVIVL